MFVDWKYLNQQFHATQNNNTLTPLFWYQITWEKLLLIECLEDSDIISIVMFRIHYSLLKKLRNNFRKSSNPMIRWIYDHFWRISRPWIPCHSRTWIPWNWRPTYSYWSEHPTTTKKTYGNPIFCKGVPVIGNLYRCPDFYFYSKVHSCSFVFPIYKKSCVFIFMMEQLAINHTDNICKTDRELLHR